MTIEIGAHAAMTSANDFVNVNGIATLGGELHLSFLNGFVPTNTETFGILRGTGGVNGAFSNVADGQRLATTDGIGSFIVRYGAASPFDHTLVVLTSFLPAVAGDYNGNGVVDAADYVVWRNGGPLQNEVATLGSVTPEDYTAWRARFGNTAGSGAGNASVSGEDTSVPEPTASLLFAIGAIAMLTTGTRIAP
jgi:hypothetical protein